MGNLWNDLGNNADQEYTKNKLLKIKADLTDRLQKVCTALELLEKNADLSDLTDLLRKI